MPGWRIDKHTSKPRSAKGRERVARALKAGTSVSELNQCERSVEGMMPVAKEIVARFLANNKQYPSLKLKCRQDPYRSQEYADAQKLHDWKCHVNRETVPEVFNYLDEHMPNWQDSHVETLSEKNRITLVTKAREIVKRCALRNGALPELIPLHEQRTPELILEHKDAMKLSDWKVAYIENPEGFCPALKTFLDKKLSDWINVEIPPPSSPPNGGYSNGVKNRGELYGTDEEVISVTYDSSEQYMAPSSDLGSGSNSLGSDNLGSRIFRSDISPLDEAHSDDSGGNACVTALLKLGSNTKSTEHKQKKLCKKTHIILPVQRFSVSTADAVERFNAMKNHKSSVSKPEACHAYFNFVGNGGRSTYGNGCKKQQSPCYPGGAQLYLAGEQHSWN